MYPIDFFWRAAARWPGNIAIDAPEGVVRYDTLSSQVAALAAGLMALDPAPQSRVGICAHNSAAHITALLAVLACGKVWVPLNPKSTRPEIGRIVDVTEPSILILDADCGALLEGAPGARIYTDAVPAGVALQDAATALGSAPASTGEPAHSAVTPATASASRAGAGETAPAAAAGTSVAALLARHAGAPRPVFTLPPEATQAIKFTGGTTGLPKGVMQPYRAWMANIANQIHAWALNERDCYILAAPITHGTSTYVLPILAQGGCHVVLAEGGAAGVREAFRTRGGTICFMPPTLIYMLMALPGATRADFPQLRRLIYGGAPMPQEKIRQVREFFGPVLGTTYGQTEAPQILTVMRPEDFSDERNWAAVGQTAWFSDVAIMDPEGNLLPAGEVGEVVARGDLITTGYWRLPEKTAETIIDGWLHTGDRGLFDERGYLYLKDRLRDLVITGGFNVYPVDVENALGQHPAVHECAVFGVPDEKWGEAVQAAVELRAGATASEAELIAFVRVRLGPVQTPKQIHFHASLPRSPVGKVLKSAVREHALALIPQPA